MQGSCIFCHEAFVIVSDINNGVDIMTTPANNGHDVVRELPVTSQWFGMLSHHKYALIWCDGTTIL